MAMIILHQARHCATGKKHKSSRVEQFVLIQLCKIIKPAFLRGQHLSHTYHYLILHGRSEISTQKQEPQEERSEKCILQEWTSAQNPSWSAAISCHCPLALKSYRCELRGGAGRGGGEDAARLGILCAEERVLSKVNTRKCLSSGLRKLRTTTYGYTDSLAAVIGLFGSCQMRQGHKNLSLSSKEYIQLSTHVIVHYALCAPCVKKKKKKQMRQRQH